MATRSAWPTSCNVGQVLEVEKGKTRIELVSSS
jgi:hypothetical protein